MSREIDLTRLPAPKAIEEISFEELFAERKARLIALCPESVRDAVAAALELESEPLTIDLQQAAYQEMLLRQRINEAAAATMLAFAADSDLDHLAARCGLQRKIITPADPESRPPREAVLESDADLRRRIQMHPEKYAAAGPAAAYVAHALDAHPDIADARAVRGRPGTVRVYIKTHSNQGRAPAEVTAAVRAYLSAEDRRPLCDTVETAAGTARTVDISYRVTYEQGPDKTLVAAKQEADLSAVLAANSGLGGRLALSKIIGALDVPGVEKIELQSPAADIVCTDGEYIVAGRITRQEVERT